MSCLRNMPESSSTNGAQNLFTVFCRHEEVVYVSQVWARDVSGAVDAWITQEYQAIPVESARRAAIAAELREDCAEFPEPIQGCVNVWPVTAFPIWLDIVQTDGRSNDSGPDRSRESGDGRDVTGEP